jgi:hypothetical protein
MVYAAYTRVSVEQTRNEIERTLVKHGAERFAYSTEIGRAVIIFEAHRRRIRFDLPLPTGDSERDRRHARERWRALLLCIKAKLEAVLSNIETFEEAFLSHVVMPDGATVGQHTRPAIETAYKSGRVPPLLPPPAEKQ